MKVLIIKLSALGDVVQALPVAMAIKRQVPDAQVDWVVESPSAGLLQGHPALDRVLVSPRHAIAQDRGSMFELAGRFLGQLRAVHYDAALDLQGLMKSAMITRTCKARRKIGFKGGKEPVAGWFLTEPLPAFDPDRHALERYLDILEPLELMRPALPEFGLKPRPQQVQEVRTLLGELGGERPLWVLHPMAKWDSKLWPVEHWARLAGLMAGMGLDLVLSGSADDQPVTRAIAAQSGLQGGLLDLSGVLDLGQESALLGLARGVVSTDTGIMHLAAALGAPVVALFGPTAPWRTGPWGPGHQVMRLEMECSPCFDRQCPQPRCLIELQPERVVLAVQKIMEE